MDDSLRTELVAGVRDQLSAEHEGSIWAVFLDQTDRPVLATSVDDGTRCLDESGTHQLGYLLGNVGAAAVVVAVPRREGRPFEADRRLYNRLRVLMAGSPTLLVDLLVVGDDDIASVGSEGGQGAVA